MWKKTLGILFISVLTTLLPAQEAEKTIQLSLEGCIVKAMKNNLGVAIEVLTPEIRDLSVRAANEKFLPSLSLDYYTTDQQQASYSFLEAADVLKSVQSQYSIDITQQIPFGGNFNLSLSNNKVDTTRTGTTINPRYGSTLRLDFTQPLLKNFGYKISRREIIIAQNNLNISEKDLQQTLQDTIYSVEEAYWNLLASIEALKVSQQSLQLARDFLERQKRAVEIGTEAPIEILTAQSEVASREADILAAEALVKNNEDRLKLIINLVAEEADAEILTIVPEEMPAFEKKEISLDEAFATALQNRPDLESTRIGIKNSELNLSFVKNQQLPTLNLNASYWSPGVSGTEIIYGNRTPENPFGVPVGENPGGISDAFKDVFGFRYKNWSVRFTLDVPLNTVISRANLAQAKVDLEQAMLRLEKQKQDVYLEIKQAVRAVETNYKRVQAYKVARELQQQKLQAEEEKFRVGLTTPYLVLQYQRDLTNSQNQELRAIVDYNLSLANLERALGISLKEKNISMVDIYSR
ncbi:MAG: TolC family protein [Candidatus Aminicenantes bacterium]|nr:TolC family protein [Candidatus Aminicenantes bacterium]MDH5742230.1 TolC family protein [Candidatus Aminicenantes bacterium]